MNIANFFILVVQYGLFIVRFFLYLKSDFLALLSVKIVVVFFSSKYCPRRIYG